MKHKFWKWVTNEAPDSFGSNRTLYLDGQISDETWWGDEVTPKAFKEEMNAGSGNITLWINSPGQKPPPLSLPFLPWYNE